MQTLLSISVYYYFLILFFFMTSLLINIWYDHTKQSESRSSLLPHSSANNAWKEQMCVGESASVLFQGSQNKTWVCIFLQSVQWA